MTIAVDLNFCCKLSSVISNKTLLTFTENPQLHRVTFPCNIHRCQLCSRINTNNIFTRPNNYGFTLKERSRVLPMPFMRLFILSQSCIYFGETKIVLDHELTETKVISAILKTNQLLNYLIFLDILSAIFKSQYLSQPTRAGNSD